MPPGRCTGASPGHRQRAPRTRRLQRNIHVQETRWLTSRCTKRRGAWTSRRHGRSRSTQDCSSHRRTCRPSMKTSESDLEAPPLVPATAGAGGDFACPELYAHLADRGFGAGCPIWLSVVAVRSTRCHPLPLTGRQSACGPSGTLALAPSSPPSTGLLHACSYRCGRPPRHSIQFWSSRQRSASKMPATRRSSISSWSSATRPASSSLIVTTRRPVGERP